ncbi:unnamed protein product [Rotaria sp. Silwood1]|nr:unnamed protein product [Rotaria sp. Silwood1]
MLDQALQSLDMETMTKMGFFIRSLHRQLEQLYNEQSSTHMEPFIVYRGQEFSQHDFEHLLAKKNGLLSFNNFLLTSTQKEVAMEYVQHALHKYEEHVGVLFIMTIDSSNVSVPTIPFAFIDKYSANPQQQEILFSTHTVFRVGEIKQTVSNNRLWEVQLTLTADNDPQLAALTQCIRKEVDGTGWNRIGQLMLKVGQFDQAEELYKDLFNNSSNDTDREYIYHQLGNVKEAQGEYKEAASFYEKSLAIKQTTLPKDHVSLAPTFSKLGLVYDNMGDYSKALESFEKASKIYEKALPPNHPDLGMSYKNIGAVYKNIGDYFKALKFYEKTHEIYEKALPPNHPDLAMSYNNIGAVYDNIGDYFKALEFYEKAHKIYEKALPSDHPEMAVSYNNIGQVYNNLENYSKALSFLEKALAIQQKSLPPSHPLIKQMTDSIDRVKSNL